MYEEYLTPLLLRITSGLRNLPHAPYQPTGPQKWARINAFSARLTTQFVKDLRIRAIETIEDALEERHLEDAKIREFFLPAAANQIIYAATPLWHLGNDPGVAPRLSPFPDWVSWRSKLGKLSESADLSKSTRELLRAAVEVMDSISRDPESNTWSCM